jgi:hypothetical protein
MSPTRKRLLFLLSAAVCVGCGAAASLPPETDVSKLANRLEEGVWYTQAGGQTGLVVPGDDVVTEDGFSRPSSILVRIPDADAAYIHGAFSVTVPDQETVWLTTALALPASETRPMTFQLYVQEGSEFPKLAEVVAQPDGQLDQMSVDLSRFRGQNILLILAATGSGSEVSNLAGLWIDPQIVTP